MCLYGEDFHGDVAPEVDGGEGGHGGPCRRRCREGEECGDGVGGHGDYVVSYGKGEEGLGVM